MTMKKIKNGSYSVILSVVAIVAVVLINMIMGKVPSLYTKLDTSEQQLFSVGAQTRELLEGLTQDVELYFIAQEGAQDATLEELLLRYDALSDRVDMEMKDPVLYPEFISQYTDERLNDNSVLVVSGAHVKTIDYYDMYIYETDYNTYTSTLTEFDGEGQLTSAIAYVTSAEIPVLYTLEGHQEAELTDDIKTAIEKENIEVKSLNLLTSEQVPEDAEMLFLYAPLADLSAEETEKVKTYLQGGGHAVILTAYTEEAQPNLEGLLEEYGLELVRGIVVEENANYHLPNYPNYLLPQVRNTEMTAGVVGRYVAAPLALGLKEAEGARDTLDITELLATSSSAFAKMNPSSTTMEKEEGDVDGAFMIGAAVSEAVETAEGDSAETRIAVFTSEYILDEQMNALVSGGNNQLIMDSLSWMSDHEVTVSIPAKSLDTGYLAAPQSAAIFWGLLTTIAMPLTLLVGGGILCYGRRKR